MNAIPEITNEQAFQVVVEVSEHPGLTMNKGQHLVLEKALLVLKALVEKSNQSTSSPGLTVLP